MPSLLTHLRTITLYAFFSFLLFGVSAALAQAASYYVSPNGGGSTCSSAAPCSLNGGLGKAGAGDEVILLDGTYRQTLSVTRSGQTGSPIIIRAQNRHKAVIEVTTYNHLIFVTASNVVIRGLKLDGTRKSATIIQLQGNRNTQSVQNVIIEDNWAVNGGKAGFFFGGVKNIVIRHNLIDSTALNSEGPDGGSPLYIAGAGEDLPASHIEIYGNVFRDFMYNAVDHKSRASNINIHHNIFEKNKPTHDGFPGDGLVRSQGSNNSAGNYFQDNIMRDSLSRYIVRIEGNRVDVLNNVFYNIDAGDFINRLTMSSAVITGNTLCNAPTGGNRGNNRLNQPQSQCDAEVARITNELKSLPGAGSGFPDGTGGFTPGPCSLYPAGSANFSPYGLHWDWTSQQKELLLKATCQTDSTTVDIGNGRETGSGSNAAGLTYVYHQGYWNTGTSGWQPYSLQCSGTDKTKIVNAWCKGSATASLPATARWFVAYSCIWTGAKWQCGCSDSTCATTYWQVQGIRR
jgi:hypothetical protein